VKPISEIYDQIAPVYDQRYQSMMHRVEDQIISDVCSRLYRPGMNVLDVGCGTGNMIDVAMFEPSDYTGIDVSESMLSKAKRKFAEYENSFHLCDATKGLNGKWDLMVGVFGIVNYIGIEQWIKLIKTNLTDDGLWMTVMYSDCYEPEYLHGEAFSYDLSDVQTELEGAGLGFTTLGLSFPLLGEALSGYDETLHQQFTLTMRSTQNCRYWILMGQAVDT